MLSLFEMRLKHQNKSLNKQKREPNFQNHVRFFKIKLQKSQKNHFNATFAKIAESFGY
jgi:hypothetical protein